eukprot:Pgem_evm1s9502
MGSQNYTPPNWDDKVNFITDYLWDKSVPLKIIQDYSGQQDNNKSSSDYVQHQLIPQNKNNNDNNDNKNNKHNKNNNKNNNSNNNNNKSNKKQKKIKKISFKNEKIEIKIITDPSHPAYNQRGLFAAKSLKMGEEIVDYLGLITTDDNYNHNSDYIISFDNCLTCDGELYGNEA